MEKVLTTVFLIEQGFVRFVNLNGRSKMGCAASPVSADSIMADTMDVVIPQFLNPWRQTYLASIPNGLGLRPAYNPEPQ